MLSKIDGRRRGISEGYAGGARLSGEKAFEAAK